MSWISSTDPCRAFAQLCFCPPLLFTSKTPPNLWFLFLKHSAARRPNKFHKMCFSWGSLACGLLPIPSKAEQSLRDLHFNPIFKIIKWVGFKKQSNNQKNKQPNYFTSSYPHHDIYTFYVVCVSEWRWMSVFGPRFSCELWVG